MKFKSGLKSLLYIVPILMIVVFFWVSCSEMKTTAQTTVLTQVTDDQNAVGEFEGEKVLKVHEGDSYYLLIKNSPVLFSKTGERKEIKIKCTKEQYEKLSGPSKFKQGVPLYLRYKSNNVNSDNWTFISLTDYNPHAR